MKENGRDVSYSAEVDQGTSIKLLACKPKYQFMALTIPPQESPCPLWQDGWQAQIEKQAPTQAKGATRDELSPVEIMVLTLAPLAQPNIIPWAEASSAHE